MIISTITRLQTMLAQIAEINFRSMPSKKICVHANQTRQPNWGTRKRCPFIMPHSNCCPNTDFIHIFKVWFAILNSNTPLFMKTWPFPIHFAFIDYWIQNLWKSIQFVELSLIKVIHLTKRNSLNKWLFSHNVINNDCDMQNGWCKELHGNILHISMSLGAEKCTLISNVFLKTHHSMYNSRTYIFVLNR